MSDTLRSVGLDVGTTSTQLIFSELTIENRASSFAVPELEIADRKILYKSPVHFTPLRDESHVDGEALRRIVEAEYDNAGIDRGSIDTGAIIITGETSRKENARAVAEAMSSFAGDFVVATAGPDLESVLAAKGAGAVAVSENTGQTLIHMDIGGGTSNLAHIRDGRILQTTCLNVGGRLIKFDSRGILTYVSPVLAGLWEKKPGDRISEPDGEALAALLVRALEMAAGLREPDGLLERLSTKESTASWVLPEQAVISFSGGVADCIGQRLPWMRFGDLGPILGQAIRRSRLCQGTYLLGQETIRATVIGAGCHSAQLSGSTVFCQNVTFPLKNIPAAQPAQTTGKQIREALRRQEGRAVLSLPGIPAPSYRQVAEMAEQILSGTEGEEVLLCLEQDMAKALGQALAARMGKDAKILCLDRVKVGEGSYLDVGAPVGPAMPVIVKTLILPKQEA